MGDPMISFIWGIAKCGHVPSVILAGNSQWLIKSAIWQPRQLETILGVGGACSRQAIREGGRSPKTSVTSIWKIKHILIAPPTSVSVAVWMLPLKTVSSIKKSLSGFGITYSVNGPLEYNNLIIKSKESNNVQDRRNGKWSVISVMDWFCSQLNMS